MIPLRGWPKGSEKTVIGLPKKGKCQATKSEPVPFLRKQPKEREKG